MKGLLQLLLLVSTAVLLFALTTAATAESDSEGIESAVVTLTDATFASQVEKGNWLIEFYAPWCSHCKHLAPVWEQLAINLKGKMNIGKVDCTQETAIASQYKVQGYPSLKYFSKGNFVTDYKGGRSLAALLEFAQRISAPPVTIVSSVEQLSALVTKSADSPLFAIVRSDPKSTPCHYSNTVAQSFQNVAQTYHTQLVFADIKQFSFLKEVLASNSKLKLWKNSKSLESMKVCDFPLFAVIRDNQLTVGDASMFESEEIMAAFVKRHRISNFPEFNQVTYPVLAELEKPIGLVLLDGALQSDGSNQVMSPRSKAFWEDARDSAKLYSEKPAPRQLAIQFAWMNAKQYISFVSNSFGLSESNLPVFIVWDPKTTEYWSMDSTQFAMNSAKFENIDAFLSAIKLGQIESKGGNGILETVRRTFFNFWSAVKHLSENSPVLLGFSAVLPLVLIYIVLRGDGNEAEQNAQSLSETKKEKGTKVEDMDDEKEMLGESNGSEDEKESEKKDETKGKLTQRKKEDSNSSSLHQDQPISAEKPKME